MTTKKCIKYDKVFKTIGSKVQFYRKVKKLTQEELAYKINKTEDTISNIERGVFGVKIETLVDIAEVLGVELADLFVDVKVKSHTKEAKKIKEIIDKLSKQDMKTINSIGKLVGEFCEKGV